MGITKLFQQKKLLIVCGVGGVGKTTLSACLALKAAQTGAKSLVITVDPSKRLAQALGLKIPCPEPKLVWEVSPPHPNLSHKERGIKEGGSLWACLLDAKHTFDHLIERYAPKDLKETILSNPLYQKLSLMLAGTQEYMAMEKLYALSSQEKFDLIVVDTPPARHAIDFLKAPLKLKNMLNDSILKFLLVPSLKMGTVGSKLLGALGHLSGSEILGDIAHLMHMSISLLDGFSKRSEDIQQLLSGDKCAFIFASQATTATLKQTAHFREELLKLGFSLDGILINRTPPQIARDFRIEKALVWAKKQEDPLWLQAATLLKHQQKIQKEFQTRLKSLRNEALYLGALPEMEEGVSQFQDIQKLVTSL